MDNAAQLKAQKEEISELKAKVATLEHALGLMAGEFEQETRETQQRALVSAQAGQVELGKLQPLLAAREKELGHMKRLAHGHAERRTELESFFTEALFQVKQEIQSSRLQYREEAQQAYHRRMSEARAGKQTFPPIRTFRRNLNSTNCVYSDMEEAEKRTNIQGNKVDISDLTWEQKERVLRMLFAKMNAQITRKPGQPPSPEKNPDVAAGITVEPSPVTFITQASVSDLPLRNPPTCLPDIRTA